ncbi:hypothetical protein C804_06567 [Lachnospiraceae bacterium A4]|nr:hypothetical protein C804_06567 [Lachnospiraceae bacterium A4]
MFEKGSEWRRWDLHIHTPETKKNDNYIGSTPDDKWNSFYSKINSYIGDCSNERKAVSVIGVTDYLSVDNYKKVIKDNKITNGVLQIFPNIEMRITPMGTNSPVNIHFIFNPDIVNELDNRFFSKLEFQGARKYNATKEDLIALGKEMGAKNQEEAYKKGIEQFVPSYNTIYELFSADVQLRENTLIGVANRSSDGASGINRGDGGDQLNATRFAVYKLCDFIFSSNIGDIEYFIGKGVDNIEEVKKKCGSLKPCFHGSDAHSLDKLFEPDKERYCWVKSDPTFNGLKQVIYEPEDRVRISSTKPEEKAAYQIIDNVIIENEDFANKPIYFNDKLTCIIGGKSTGKSLLLQNIARTIDNKQVEEKLEISGVSSRKLSTVKVVWKDGDVSVNGSSDQTHKIVYIPQTYLNRLTDVHEDTSEIDKIIQDIVLMNSLCKQSFEKMESDIKNYKPELDKKIYDLLQMHSEMVLALQERNDIGTESGIKKEIERLEKQKNTISKEVSISEDELKEYDLAVKNIAEVDIKISYCDNDLIRIKELSVPIQKFQMSSNVSDEIAREIEKFQNALIDDAMNKWTIKKEELLTNIKIKKLNFEAERKKNIEIRDRLSIKVQESEALSKLTEQIKNEEEKLSHVQAVSQKYSSKKTQYEKLLDDISNSICVIRDIRKSYATLVNDNEEINSDGLEFSVDILSKNVAFCTFIKSNINNNTLKKLDISFDENFKVEQLTNTRIKEIISKTIDEDFKLLKGKNVEGFIRELLSDWNYISYNVKMENDYISQMSPGKKALVLLKLLISMADSKCPILIDQPEDDLDNRSIFDELIPFIREKKIIRQIIVVTHNANVVLGGDAEEIIVANQNGNNSPNYCYRFEYRSGSIENDNEIRDENGKIKKGILNEKGIQQHICDILEGGEKAFDLRRNKYRI